MAAKSSTADPVLPNPFLAAVAQEAARDAGLRYFSDARPGIRRQRKGKEFRYVLPTGGAVTDQNTLVRIKRLAIPPAWEEVWICPFENGHIQATGRDARGRKQYRYHPKWREQRDQSKYERMMGFAEALPKIRARIKSDLQLRGLPRDKVLATVVRLLEATLIRVGNDEYARQNHSYGLTTMHDRHVKIRGGKISFSFKGKSGKRHEIALHDPNLAKIVKRCQDLPGQELFAYQDEDGKAHDIGSQDVNEYLRRISGHDFTAKDFRTWSGTVLAAIALRECETFTSKAQAKKNVVSAVEAVSKMLGNTPAVCRKCYVHPLILDSYLEGSTIEVLKQRVARQIDSPTKLKPEETAVLAFLRARLDATKSRLGPRGGAKRKPPLRRLAKAAARLVT